MLSQWVAGSVQRDGGWEDSLVSLASGTQLFYSFQCHWDSEEKVCIRVRVPRSVS